VKLEAISPSATKKVCTLFNNQLHVNARGAASFYHSRKLYVCCALWAWKNGLSLAPILVQIDKNEHTPKGVPIALGALDKNGSQRLVSARPSTWQLICSRVDHPFPGS
jgi:hypothetical protein